LVIGVPASLVISDTFRLTEGIDYVLNIIKAVLASVLGEEKPALERWLQQKAAFKASFLSPSPFVSVCFSPSLKGI